MSFTLAVPKKVLLQALRLTVLALVVVKAGNLRAITSNIHHRFSADQNPALALNKEHSPNPGQQTWQIGLPITYVITVNNGGIASSHVRIQDAVPAGFVVTGTGCTGSGGAKCNPPLVPPSFGDFEMPHDSSLVLTISGYYTSTGTKSNDAEATAKDDQGNPIAVGSANKDSDTVIIPTSTVPWDLGITKSVTPTTASFPATIHYKLTVTNNSPSTIQPGGIVKIRDVMRNNSPIPVGTAISNYTCAPAALCPDTPPPFSPFTLGQFQESSLNLQWTGSNTGAIPPNGSFTIDFDVRLTTTANCSPGTVRFENRAFLEQANSQTVLADTTVPNNSAPMVSTTLTGLAATCPPLSTIAVAKAPTSPPVWDLPNTTNDAVSYTITLTNPNAFALTNVDLTDSIYKAIGTPPFTATVISGPACSGCSSALTNVVLSTPVVTGDFTTAVLWKARLVSLSPSQSVTIAYTVGYAPVCETDPRPNAIVNIITAAPSNASANSGAVAIRPPEIAKCELDVEKIAVTPGPIQFGIKYEYDVVYRNLSPVTARTVGTLRDTIAIDSSVYGDIPFVYSVSCAGAGVSPLPSATNVPGMIKNVPFPWMGTRIIDQPNVTLQPLATLTCRVEITPQRPRDDDPFCQGTGDPKLVNAAYLDLSPNYNPNDSNQPGFYDEVRTDLPLCRKLLVTKTPSAKSFGPGANFTYTIRVENHGDNAVSGVTLADLVPHPLTVTGVSGCSSPTTSCSAGPTHNGNSVSVTFATLLPNQPVTFDIMVTAPDAGGSYDNVAVAAFVPGGNFYFQGDPTKLLQNEANVTVVTPTLAKGFAPGTIAGNGTSTLTFTITNTNSDPKQTGISFTDMLPPGLQIGSAVTNTCGGTVTVSSDGRSISLTGGQLVGTSANGSGRHTCQITARVSALGVCGVFANNKTNFTKVGNLDVSNAEATLNVVECPPGGLVIRKDVEGAPDGWSGTFTFNVSCTGNPVIQKTVTVQWPSPGFTTIPDIPVGRVCTVTEGPRPGSLPHDYSWSGNPVYTPGEKVEIPEKGATVSILNRMGHEENACMRIPDSEVTCEVDGSGKPTGRYVWRFRFQNLSGRPISHLFIAQLPSPVAAVPTEHVVFGTPVTGLSPVVQITFANAQPGPLSFRISLHDQTLECCSFPVTIELPACDCAQVVGDVKPVCFNKSQGVPPPYKYTFTLQNLSPLLVQNVLVAPVSPIDHLTPIPPSAIAVDKTVHPIAPVGPGGTIGPLTVALSGPQAVGGSEVCLNLSIHTQDLDTCCSIIRCFRLPECWIKGDYDPIGDVVLGELEPGFVIDNIGVTGNDGVRVPLHDARAVGLAWRPLDSTGPLPDGAFIELTAAGNPDEATGTLRVTQSEGKYRIETSIGDAQSYRVEVFDGGQLVGEARHLGNGNVIVVWPIAARAEIAGPTEDLPEETLGFTLDTERAVPWQLSDGSTLTGDRFRITPEDSIGPVSLQQLDLRAASIPRIEVTGVSIFNDCNGNGVPDAEDIANGTSADENGDGVPDDCVRAADLEVSLNSGFDQETGTLLALGALPAGTDDDDWRVTAGGTERAAKLVIDPSVAWPTPLPDSRWISFNPDSGRSVPGTSQLSFERCFCVSENAGDVTLDLQFRADDTASVFLNDVQLGATGGSFSGPPLRIQQTEALGSLFRAGRNCVRIEVNDSGGVVTGLDLTGWVRATNGACETP